MVSLFLLWIQKEAVQVAAVTAASLRCWTAIRGCSGMIEQAEEKLEAESTSTEGTTIDSEMRDLLITRKTAFRRP